MPAVEQGRRDPGLADDGFLIFAGRSRARYLLQFGGERLRVGDGRAGEPGKRPVE